MKDTQEIEKLLREVVDEEPKNSCAENPTTCIFCCEEWNRTWRGAGISHDPSCLLVRACTALDIPFPYMIKGQAT
jgi:hypothetical protein